MTDNAIERLKVLLAKKPDAYGIRLGVRTRGCNGLSYTLNYAYGREKFEEMVEENGVRVLIEPKALMHIVGTSMDYKEDALTAEFTFVNPNAKGECGCGESFNT
jgi:iron-sulfur cluster assembly accessory protein